MPDTLDPVSGSSLDQMENEQQSSRRLGEYKVVKDIAEGTFGKVKSNQSQLTADTRD